MTLDMAVNQFRLASRELFNHYFRASVPDDDAWILLERFGDIEQALFHKLVIEPAGLTGVRYGQPHSEIVVSLRNEMNVAPIMLNRDVDSGYWDHPLSQVTADAKMVFVSFFDWDPRSYRDHQYVRVKVLYWPGHSEVNGKHALIGSQDVLFEKIPLKA
jgi:hypothetical protein